MNKSVLRYLNCALFWIFLIATCLIKAYVPVVADSGIKVTGAILTAEVGPGDKIVHRIEVNIDEASLPADFTIQVLDMGQAMDGALFGEESDNTVFSARNYIKLDKSKIHVEPGASGSVMALITVPDNPGDGGKYAIINIKSDTVGQESVGVIASVNVPVYLTIKNSRALTTGKISEIKIKDVKAGSPIEIVTLYQNTGNIHYKATNQVTISDDMGKTLDTIYLSSIGSSIIPGSARELKTTYIPDSDLVPGVYHVLSRVFREDGTLLDEKGIDFEIKNFYKPPESAATVVVTPKSQAVLKDNEGRVSIFFPCDAVTEKVSIIMREYPFAQAPLLPEKYILMGTCFRIEGFSGLLLKKAKISVNLSGVGLDDVAVGISQLRLARWDEIAGKWEIYKTKFDSKTMILSTETDRFSIWAVVAVPNTVNNGRYLIMGSVIWVFICSLALACWYMKRHYVDQERDRGRFLLWISISVVLMIVVTSLLVYFIKGTWFNWNIFPFNGTAPGFSSTSFAKTPVVSEKIKTTDVNSDSSMFTSRPIESGWPLEEAGKKDLGITTSTSPQYNNIVTSNNTIVNKGETLYIKWIFEGMLFAAGVVIMGMIVVFLLRGRYG